MDKLHKNIVKGLGHNDTSPKALAYKMLKESRYVNETMLQYAVNYITIMATNPIIPVHLADVHKECKMIYTSLEELGLKGTVGREVVLGNEYLQT